jgi:predicted outer membrane protein
MNGTMRRNFFLGAVAAASITVASRVDVSAQYIYGAVTPRPMYSDTRDFLLKMTLIARSQVELGSMAMQRATRPDVTAFARTMLTDYTKVESELAALMADMSVGARSVDDSYRLRERRLDALWGKEFEREYVQAMFEMNQDVVSMLRIWTVEASKREDDDPVTRWANDMLRRAEQYLEKARQLNQTVR